MHFQRIRPGAKFLALAVLCVCLFPSFLRSQSTTQGAIAGTVVDSSGAAVGGAAITLRNAGTNAEINLTADPKGHFKAPQVPPGTYSVTISATGFGIYNRSEEHTS